MSVWLYYYFIVVVTIVLPICELGSFWHRVSSNIVCWALAVREKRRERERER